MKKIIKSTRSELSEAAELCESAVSRAPRIRKEITVRSSYYSAKGKKHPCAETLLQLDIDCNLLKLGIVIAVGVIMLWAYCSMKRRKRSS